MAKQFLENGLAYVCLDFHGHGYSDGVKGIVDSKEFLLDDVFCLLRALYSDTPAPMGQNGARSFWMKTHAKNVPFFIMGHSMGGSTAIYVGHMLSTEAEKMTNKKESKESFSSLFRGCLLLCPAIDIKMPPAIVVTTLNYLIVPFFRNYPVPEIFAPRRLASQHLLWRNKNFQDYVTRDGYPGNEKGLSYGDPVRFQTASTLIKLAGGLNYVITKIRFPFIVFHDPLEQIVLVKGSEKLIEKSLTSKGNKVIVLVDGGLHDLLSNSFTLVTKKSIEWIKYQLNTKPEPEIIMVSACDQLKNTKVKVVSINKPGDLSFLFLFLLGGLFTFMAVLRFQAMFIYFYYDY
jgi:alpha-beta hydrolase superfamily lysophospholipase